MTDCNIVLVMFKMELEAMLLNLSCNSLLLYIVSGRFGGEIHSCVPFATLVTSVYILTKHSIACEIVKSTNAARI